jgi:predicted ATPase/DNA-binding SARP family transcriptional activator
VARLSLFLLGPFGVSLEGQPVTGFESDKVRALLAYLAVEAERPHRRQTLAGLLWPEFPERTARRNLRNALYNLRQVIRERDATPPVLSVTRDTVQFDLRSDHWLDVATCTSLLTHKQAVHQLEEAVALYRGPFLEGFSLRDSPAFEDWSLLVRERLLRQVLDALSHLAAHYEARGAYSRACEYARRQVDLEPWQEEAHRLLMRLLALSGRRGTALVQYEVCCRILREELGVKPASETVHLYERIRDGEVGAVAQQATRRHNLPASLTPLVGRERELAELEERLRDPGCRLLTLVGPGGCGKTRLAIEAAAKQVESFNHGVYFVSLAPLQSADAILPTVAQALGFTLHIDAPGVDVDVPGQHTLEHVRDKHMRQRLLDYLREKHLLLLLDNFEHLLGPPGPTGVSPLPTMGESVGLVGDLLRAAPEVKVMVTSRARLNARGEHLYLVRGMDLPGPEERDDILGYGSVQLFVQSARRVQPPFEYTSDDLTNIAQICQLIDGMPLAILLAAAWTEMLAPAEIVEQIVEQSLNFFEIDWRDVPARQRGMRAVFDHSWNLLSEQQQEVFRSLAVFLGGFDRESAWHVAGASLQALRALVDRSFLHRLPSGRYEVHELMRQYGAEKLRQSPDRGGAVRDRHAAYFCAALQRWAEDMKGPRLREALDEIQADVANARAAWDWAVEQGQTARLDQAMDGLCRFYEWRGRHQEGEAACRQASTKLDRAEYSQPCARRALAKVLTWQASFNNNLGRVEQSCPLLDQAMALLQAPELADDDTRKVAAFILQVMGEVTQQFDHTQAQALCERSLTLYRSLGDQWGMATVLMILSGLAEHFGDYGRARELADESLLIYRSLGDRIGIARSLRQLSNLFAWHGQFEESECLAREVIAICGEIGDRVGIAKGRFSLASTTMYLGRFGDAHPLLVETASAFHDLGMRTNRAWVIQIRGWNETNLGLYEAARRHCTDGLAFFHEADIQRGIAMAHLGLGGIALAKGEYVRACKLLEHSAAVYREIDRRDELGLALASLALVARGLGHLLQAHAYTCEALRLSIETGSVPTSLFAVSNTALLLADAGAVERAVELYALVTRHPYFGNSRYREDITGGYIVAAAAALAPQTVAAAQERGRARDLDATVAELVSELEAR